MNVEFLDKVPNPLGVLHSKAVGEPPLLLGCAVVFAARAAVQVRHSHRSSCAGLPTRAIRCVVLVSTVESKGRRIDSQTSESVWFARLLNLPLTNNWEWDACSLCIYALAIRHSCCLCVSFWWVLSSGEVYLPQVPDFGMPSRFFDLDRIMIKIKESVYSLGLESNVHTCYIWESIPSTDIDICLTSPMSNCWCVVCGNAG